MMRGKHVNVAELIWHSGNMKENHSESRRGTIHSPAQTTGLLGGPTGLTCSHTSVLQPIIIHNLNKKSVMCRL